MVLWGRRRLSDARRGLSRQSAVKVTISTTRRTVEFHVGNIFRKLDLTSRVELAAMLASGAVSGAKMIERKGASPELWR